MARVTSWLLAATLGRIGYKDMDDDDNGVGGGDDDVEHIHSRMCGNLNLRA